MRNAANHHHPPPPSPRRAGRGNNAAAEAGRAAESNLGNAYAQLGDAHRALARQRRTVHLSESLYEREPTVQNLDGLAGALSNLGNALRHQGMLDEGMEANKRARDLLNSAQQEGTASGCGHRAGLDWTVFSLPKLIDSSASNAVSPCKFLN